MERRPLPDRSQTALCNLFMEALASSCARWPCFRSWSLWVRFLADVVFQGGRALQAVEGDLEWAVYASGHLALADVEAGEHRRLHRVEDEGEGRRRRKNAGDHEGRQGPHRDAADGECCGDHDINHGRRNEP